MSNLPDPICVKRKLRREVCAVFGVDETALLGRSRDRQLVDARYAFALVAKARWPHFSYPRIAKMLGGRDHSTIIHGITGFRERMARDLRLAAIVDQLLAERPAHQHNAHVLEWRKAVLNQAEAQARRLERVAAASPLSNGLPEVVAEGVRVINLSRRVKAKNVLVEDDRDALKRKVASDGLSQAIAAAGGWR